LLRSSKFPKVTHEQTINLTFNLVFFFCSTSFLILYHKYFIHPELNRESAISFSKRRNVLFYQPCDFVKFKIVTFCNIGFEVAGCLLNLSDLDICSVISKLLFSSLLMICYIGGLENFSCVLCINLGLYKMFSDLLSLLALQSNKEQTMKFRVFAGFKMASWVYIFLNFLPFQYLVPTFKAKDVNFTLNLFLLSWYVSNIWTSPLLQAIYHQLYHHLTGCPGENSVTRCIMLRDTSELQHYNILKRSILEVKLHHQRHQINKLNLGETAASAKTFQTIKCVMTLKRKLRRIRSSKLEHQHQN